MHCFVAACLLALSAALFWSGGAVCHAATIKTDSIIDRVFTYPERQNLRLYAFSSESYLRFQISTKRRNFICKYIPGLFPLERGERQYIGEALLHSQFSQPGMIDQKVVALHSTLPPLDNLTPRITDNVNVSLYNATLLTGRILSPVNARNRKFYKYRHTYDYTSSTGDTLHHIEVIPRFHNTQLVQGYIEVQKKTGGVRRFDFTSYYDFIRLHVAGQLGMQGEASLVPEELHFTTRLNLVGNKIRSRFDAQIKYLHIQSKPDSTTNGSTTQGYDLTENNRLKTDTSHMRTDRAFFDSIRPYPLRETEIALYADTLRPPADTVTKPSRRRILSSRAEDFLFGNHNIDFRNRGSLRLPPIITPSMFQWSHQKGVSLQTRFTAHMPIGTENHLGADIRVGYTFKQRQLYWRVPLTFLFAPELNAKLHVEVGNGNIIYNSEQADAVRKALEGVTQYDSLLHVFDHFDFQYYKDFYVQGNAYFEPLAGLNLTAGIRFHDRTLQNWNALAEASGMAQHIRSVAPHLRAEWTPGTYYYRDQQRCIPLYSHWPTFTIDYERGIKWGKCETEYERWEAGISYQLRLYALRKLYFRLGGGLYTNQNSVYFVDFDNFRDNNMPEGWDDEMSGQFQLLDSRWYNESPYYVRLCTAYESPMLLLSRIKYLSNYIQKEHVYCNLLSVHALQPYAEIGYGLSTHLFNAAAFFSMANGAGFSFGAKFSICLFNNW